jgi:hypothetical protein
MKTQTSNTTHLTISLSVLQYIPKAGCPKEYMISLTLLLLVRMPPMSLIPERNQNLSLFVPNQKEQLGNYSLNPMKSVTF